MHVREIALRLLPPIAALAAWVAAPVRADEKNPAVEACAGKSEGAPCVTKRFVQQQGSEPTPQDEPGTCQPDQCCELDYSQGSPPKSNCGPCLACKPGVPTTATGGDAGSNDTHAEPPRGEDGGPPAHEPSKKGCAIGGDGFGGASLLVIIGLLLRRRTR